jgi:V/A-type H+-transporting ATPase subunit K
MEIKGGGRLRIGKVLTLALLVGLLGVVWSGGTALAADGQTAVSQKQAAGQAMVRWDLAVAIAVAIGLPCLAAGYAVARVGAAALGAASEKPELLTRSLLFVALAEGIAIYGLLVAVLLYLKF